MMNLSLIRKIAAINYKIKEDTKVHEMTEYFKYPIIPTYSTGELLDHQIEHAERLKFVLKSKGLAADTSKTGDGKNYCSAYEAKDFEMPVMAFCPKVSRLDFYKVLSTFGVPVVTVTNYDMARSSHSDKYVKWYDTRSGYTETATICPWITKREVIDGKKNKIVFDWSGVPYRCFIIFDEEHFGKNVNTQTFQFIKGAVKAAKKYGHKILFLSATPIEKDTNLKSIAYFLGLVPKANMRAVNTFFKSQISSTDMSDIHNYLYNVKPNDPKNSTGSISYMPSAKMPKDLEHDIKPLTFTLSEETTKMIQMKNREIVEYRKQLSTGMKKRVSSSSLGDINGNRNLIENYKSDLFVQLAIEGLTKERIHEKTGKTLPPFKRVGIFVNYKATLRDVRDKLSAHFGEQNVGVLYGEQHDYEAKSTIEAYKQGKLKILIATIKKGGQSLSLHDTEGDKETLTLISPPTSASSLIQTLGRHHRTNIKSSLTQIIVFAAGDPIEESIRNALSIKLNDICNFTIGRDNDFKLYDIPVKEELEKEKEQLQVQ